MIKSLKPQDFVIGKLVTFPLMQKKRGIGIIISSQPGPGCQQHNIMVPYDGGTTIHGPFMSHELGDAETDPEIKG